MKSEFVIKDAFKTFTLDQDKILSPEQTVSQFKARTAGMRLKIFEKTRRIDNGRLDIPVYFSICGSDAERLTGTKKQMGKGATPQQAEASAVMELAERFSFFAFYNDPSNFIVDTYRNVAEDAIPFELIVKSVHDETADTAAARAIFEDLPLKWTWGCNLTKKTRVLIPFNWFYTINEFNGPSAGNCNEEALLQGICEVVERHVSSLVSRNGLSVPGIDPASVADPVVREMLEKYEKAGIRLYISDFSLDTGIPTVGVLAYDPGTFPESSEIVWTAGTTPSPEKALSRSLTEVAQLAGDFNTGANYVASGLPKLKAITEADHIIHPDEKIRIDALPDLSNENIKIEIENCLAALADNGLEVLSVDIAHPELGIPAFYTIIPGAHFRERAEGTSVGMFAAKIAVETHSPETALEILEKMAEKMPGKYYHAFYQGTCLLALERPEAAVPCFRRALALEPKMEDIPSIYAYMGICLKDMGEYEPALEVLAKGIALDADRTDIHNLMGFCNFMLKRHTEAIACFQRVLRLDPSSAIDYANIGSNYRDMGETEKAIQYYTMALELDPGIEFARDNLTKLRKDK